MLCYVNMHHSSAAAHRTTALRPRALPLRAVAAAAVAAPSKSAAAMAARSSTALRAARGGSDATSSSSSDKAAAPAKQPQQQQQAEAAAAAAAANTTPTAAAAADADEDEVKSDAYTSEMQAKMGTSLTYRHELGINWNEILPDLVVGSCLQGPEDVDRVAAAGVTTVLCLQEDSDLEYFGIDVAAIAARCKARGDIKHVRFPIRDFDPFDLRQKLPKAVSRLAQAHDPRYGIVYIHCTAGLGRAPATALAYMAWLRGWDITEAYGHLTARRACSPRVEAVRAATADLLTGAGPVPVTLSLARRGTAKSVQIAGLDVGWHRRIDLEEHPATRRLEVTRPLLPGTYPFKFIIDDVWSASADYPTMKDGDNINNVVTVLPRDAGDAAARDRLLSPAGRLTGDERAELASLLCPWASHDAEMHAPRAADKAVAEAAAAAAAKAGKKPPSAAG